MMERRTLRISLFIFLLIAVHIATGQNSYRDRQMQPERLMDSLGVKPGMIIGEAGAGRGYFTFWLSKRVGETGKVYANDIDEGVLRSIRNRCNREGIENIETIVGEVEDPLFPQHQMDMVVMMYVFHDLEKPVAFMKNVKRALKPGAHVGIIDRDPDKYSVDRYHFLTKGKILKYLDQAGYEIVEIETFLERENVYICRPIDEHSSLSTKSE
jgi:ubiquinone/menaquinone biosynthesis C-methylase UbiE